MHICCSVVKLCPALCDPMDCSTPGLPVFHRLLELAQTYVHGVSDAIQPPHPLSSPSAPAFNLSQHQRLLQCFGSSHQVAGAYWSFNFSISPSSEHSGLIPLRLAGSLSLLSKQPDSGKLEVSREVSQNRGSQYLRVFVGI